MAIGPVVTRGYGTFGSVNLVVTRGYAVGVAAPAKYPGDTTISGGYTSTITSSGFTSTISKSGPGSMTITRRTT
jgi:hypothetical protein